MFSEKILQYILHYDIIKTAKKWNGGIQKMSKIRSRKGITLITLVVTIIVLLILSGVTISLIAGNNGLLTKAKKGEEEHIRQEATEAMNLKIIGIQMESYDENKSFPNLQYLADKLCEDEEEMEYVLLKSKKEASLEKIDTTDADSIYTKIKKYPYEFEINSSLKLASIDGVKLEDDNTSNSDLLSRIENIELEIKELQRENSELKNNAILNIKEKLTAEDYNPIEVPLKTTITSGDFGSINLIKPIEEYKYLEFDVDILQNGISTCRNVHIIPLYMDTVDLHAGYSRKFCKYYM